MRKLLLAVGTLAFSTGAHAAIVFNFGSPTGNLGTTEVYTDSGGSGLQVTATGYNNSNVLTDLWGKGAGGDENGIGLANDPTGDHEIAFGFGHVQLDLAQLLGKAANVNFFMGSSTSGEAWNVYGSNTAGTQGSFLLTGTNEASQLLPSFGQYRYYNFYAKNAGNNVLLGGLSGIAAVPEPATWAMMLLGLGGIGWALRRKRQTLTTTVSYKGFSVA